MKQTAKMLDGLIGNMLNHLKDLDETGGSREIILWEQDIGADQNGEPKKITSMSSVSMQLDIDEVLNKQKASGGVDGEGNTSLRQSKTIFQRTPRSHL